MEQQIEILMDNNQALKAWDLIKDTNDLLKDRVWLKVKHAFDEQAYKDYYMNDLIEYPVIDELVYDATAHSPRFGWLIPKLMQIMPKSVLDIGCADGYLGLTLGRWGIPSVGLNLYNPSVELARGRARVNHLPAKFEHMDFRDYDKQHEVVVFFEILEHLPDPVKAIEKAFSLVKNGGRLYISTPVADKHIGITGHLADPNRESWMDDKPAGHLRLFTEQELKDLLKDYNVTDFYIDEEFSMEVEVAK